MTCTKFPATPEDGYTQHDYYQKQWFGSSTGSIFFSINFISFIKGPFWNTTVFFWVIFLNQNHSEN